jgi:hypothetical protein
MPYSVRGKNFLLTYPAAQNYVGLLDTAIADRLIETGCLWVEVVLEFHADGTPHYHAVVSFTNTYSGYAEDFAVGGCAPDIQTIQRGREHMARSRAYLRKGPNDVLQRGCLEGVPSYDAPERYSWGKLLADATSQQDFCSLVAQHFPKEWVLRHHDILAFASDNYNSPANYTPIWPRESYTLPAHADAWVEENITRVSTA